MALRFCTIPALLVCLLSVCAKAEERNSAAPWFCHGIDCPKFKVLNTTKKYEIRQLEKTEWAATTVKSLLYSVGVTEGFGRLFKYIGGANEQKTKIDMTAPVLTRVTPGEGPFCKSTFYVHFFMPFKWQANPPKPSNALVSIERAPVETFAVTQFGGFLVDDYTLSSKAEALSEALLEDGIDNFDSDVYFVASYDPPYRLQHRHNEVWFKLTNKAEQQILKT